MKKFLERLSVCALYFIIFMLFINVLFLGTIMLTDFNFRKRLESLKFVNPEFKLLVLGKSLAMDGIDAELLTRNGLKTYNLAIGGSSLRTNYIQLEEYLSRYNHKPETILIGLGSYLGLSDGDDIHPIIEVSMKNHRFNFHDLPLIKFQWLGEEFSKKIVSSAHRNAKLSSGQLKFRKTSSDNTIHRNIQLDIKPFENAFYLGEIARLCNQNNIDLLIIEMPGFKNTQNSSRVGPYLLSFANGESARLYNFNSKEFCEIFDKDNDWIANSHLNEFGAEKFTKELLKFLDKSYLSSE